MNDFDFLTKLRPGNLVHVVLEGGEHQYQPLIKFDIRPDEKRSFIIKTMDERAIVKFYPAVISKILLEAHGFLFDANEDSPVWWIRINRNTILRVKQTKAEDKFLISIDQAQIKGTETEKKTVILGQFTFWYVIENFYETLTNRNLIWQKTDRNTPQ